MVHHRQRLALGLKAGDDLPAVHPRLDDLKRDAAFDGSRCSAIQTSPKPPSPILSSSL
jgi:hypothetical protein